MKRSQGVVGVLILIGSVMAAGRSADAATYYVARTGNNVNSCSQAQQPATPKQTINGAVSCLRAGDTLYVRGGTYPETLIDPPLVGTSWSSAVRIAAYPGETVWMKPSSGDYVLYLSRDQKYVEFDGINMDTRSITGGAGIIKITAWTGGNPHHVRIQNAELVAGPNGVANQGLNGAHAITASASIANPIGNNEFVNLRIHGGGDAGDMYYGLYINSGNNLIEGCDIYDVAGAAIHIYSGNGSLPNNNVIRNNVIHDIYRTMDDRTYGMVIATGTANKIYNNLVYNIQSAQSFGIRLYSPSHEVYNNTVYNVRQFGIEVLAGASGAVIRNNVAYRNGTNYINHGAGVTLSNNSFDGSDPGFVSPTSGDFKLASSSRLIDSGIPVPMVTADIGGILRPQQGTYDIGAHEFRLNGNPPGAPSNIQIVRY